MCKYCIFNLYFQFLSSLFTSQQDGYILKHNYYQNVMISIIILNLLHIDIPLVVVVLILSVPEHELRLQPVLELLLLLSVEVSSLVVHVDGPLLRQTLEQTHWWIVLLHLICISTHEIFCRHFFKTRYYF